MAQRRKASRTRSGTARRSSRSNYGSKRRTTVRRVRGGSRRTARRAASRELVIRVETGPADAGRPEMPTQGAPSVTRKARF